MKKNPIAKALQSNLFRQRKVENKKIYNRKRSNNPRLKGDSNVS